MRRPRVLFVNHTSDVSGAEISLLLMARSLANYYDVIIAAPEGELLERARRNGIPVSVFPAYIARESKNLLVLLKGVIGTYKASRKLNRIVLQLRPDIVHANTIRAGLIVSVLKNKEGIRVVWHVRDNLKNNLLGQMIRKVARRRVDHIVTISKAIKKNFSDELQLLKKTTVVYNGVDIDETQLRNIRPELGTSHETFVVGVVGQITPWKRQQDAIEGFADFASRISNSELWIVGEAKFREENHMYKSKLRERVNQLGLEDRVRFLGFRSDVMNVMSSIDLLLLPSENEPFGRVIIEAMFAGKPVVGTNRGGVPEIVLDGETGLLVDAGNVEAISHAIYELYRTSLDKQALGILAEKANRRVLEYFSVTNVADSLRKIYGRILSS